MRGLRKPLIIAVIVLFVQGIAKDQGIKAAVTIGVSEAVGAPVHIDGMSVGIFRQSVRIRGFKMYNPSGFPRGLMVDIPVISVEYDLGAILKGDLHLPLLVLDLKEMTVVKNREGKLNVDALKVAQTKGAKPSKTMALRVDTATLDLGRVMVKDYTGGGRPGVQTYNIGVHHKTYRNIKSVEQLTVLVMVEAMKPTALKSAGIYGAAGVLGVAFLPAAAAGVVLEKVYHRIHK